MVITLANESMKEILEKRKHVEGTPLLSHWQKSIIPLKPTSWKY